MSERRPSEDRISALPHTGGHLLGAVPHHLDGLHEEPPRGVHVPLLARQRVGQGAVAIDRPVQIARSPLHLHVRLAHIPPRAGLAAPRGPQLLNEQRGANRTRVPGLPFPRRLVGEDDAPLQEDGAQVPQAQSAPDGAA